jgi:hypothetical protein
VYGSFLYIYIYTCHISEVVMSGMWGWRSIISQEEMGEMCVREKEREKKKRKEKR